MPAIHAAAGCFVAIVGPSGAGKDTLIADARRRLDGDAAFHFVRRLVTRAANPHEDHDTIGEAEFALGSANGSFALSWRAHGLGYAIPAAILAEIAGGTVAVCNLSREVVGEARNRFPSVAVVSITAPPEILARRLAARGRESVEAVAARLRREAGRAQAIEADLVIGNDRPLRETGAELADFLSSLRSRSASAPRP